jgi:hypothetical protein
MGFQGKAKLFEQHDQTKLTARFTAIDGSRPQSRASSASSGAQNTFSSNTFNTSQAFLPGLWRQRL